MPNYFVLGVYWGKFRTRQIKKDIVMFKLSEVPEGFKYYVVRFHADGGQMCVPGVRTFTDRDNAYEFAEVMDNEEGHFCEDSVSIEWMNENPPEDDGIVYPGVALS